MFGTKRSRVLIIIMVFMLCFLSACATDQRPGTPTTPNAPPDDQTQQEQMPNQQINDDQNRSRQIVQKVEQEVSEVNSATVVISGNQAWIGIDAKANAEVSDQTKERISNLVKETDQGIQTVYVTADVDTVTRLRNIANDIATGRPISGFLTELTEIANRISPLPR